ncbi:MAG: hypothetical protein PUC59_02525 [Firmicutes bacterium]|nr:hypothetical protein [Bacillota bacterium]
MDSMQAVCLNHIFYCRFPEGIHSIHEFVDFLNRNYHSFIKLEVFLQEGCIAPYFTGDKTEIQYWNPSFIHCLTESEIHLCTEAEYEERLRKVIQEKCVHCIYHSEDVCKQDFESYREHLSLDGECCTFERKH